MTDKPLCLALCTPHYDRPHSRYVECVNLLWKPSNAPGARIPGLGTHRFTTVGKPVAIARNMMTGDALAAEPKVTHLLWIDDDMEFPEHALYNLLAYDVPIVGGLCHSRHFPYHPLLGKKHHDDRGYGFCYHYPPNSLFEVDVTGGAFLLVKREVFEKMNEAGYYGKWWSERNERSEDFSFCELAKSLGYKIYVDTGLEIGHATEIMMTSETSKKLRPPFEWEAWMPDPGVQPGEPLATIVIPTYNQNPRWLKAAVLSAARQTKPVEVIVVDDGSDIPVRFDGWPENVTVLRHFIDGSDIGVADEEIAAIPDCAARVRPYNRGVSAALNTGIKYMRTKWFCWLSSDDILDPRKVHMQLAALLQSGGKMSFHRYQQTGGEGIGFSKYAEVERWRNMEEQRKILSQYCAINGSTVMIHKDVLDDLGLFDVNYKYGQDYEAWCRYGQKYYWYFLDEILGTRRELDTNLTSTINRSPANDERRMRRDAEDLSIRARYAWPR